MLLRELRTGGEVEMTVEYMFPLYSFPNPNDGENYNLTKEELVQLLDKAYSNGYEHAREVFDPALQPKVTVAVSTGWKEVQIK